MIVRRSGEQEPESEMGSKCEIILAAADAVTDQLAVAAAAGISGAAGMALPMMGRSRPVLIRRSAAAARCVLVIASIV